MSIYPKIKDILFDPKTKEITLVLDNEKHIIDENRNILAIRDNTYDTFRACELIVGDKIIEIL